MKRCSQTLYDAPPPHTHTQTGDIALNNMRYRRVKQYKGQVISILDSLSYVKVQEYITYKRANMYPMTNLQEKAIQ